MVPMVKESKENIPERVKELRKYLGMTKEQFAHRLGVSFSTVNRWETGRSKPTPLALGRMAELEAQANIKQRQQQDDAWWVREVEQLRPRLLRFVQRRMPDSPADDVLGETLLQLIKMFRERSSDYPDEWFRDVEPKQREANAFRSLVWRMMRLRVHDKLRRRYVRLANMPRYIDELRISDTSAVNPDDRIDARRFLEALAVHVDRLPDEDRLLLTASIVEAAGGHTDACF